MAVHGGHAGYITLTENKGIEQAVRAALGKEADGMAVINKMENGANSTVTAVQTDHFTVFVTEYRTGEVRVSFETGRFE
jgi:hypothetical protein